MHKRQLYPSRTTGAFENQPGKWKHSRALPGMFLTLILAAPGIANADGPTTRYHQQWQRQFGTANGERAYGVAADGAFVFAAGQIDRGNFPGETNSGMADCFVSKYANGGAAMWTRQFGTAGSDLATAVAAGGGALFVAGSTTGMFSGHTNAGGVDIFVCRFDANMQIEWTFMTGSAGDDEASAIVFDRDCLYVAGWTNDALPGQTHLGSFDACVIKLDLDGNVVWIRQFGSAAYDKAHALACDGDGVYVAGRAGSALPNQSHNGSADVYVRRYTADGDEVWTEQFGTATADVAYGIAVDATGIYVAGKVSGALPGQQHWGGSDCFLRKLDTSGTEEWTSQFGTFGMEEAFGVAVHHKQVYVVGITSGSLSALPAWGAGDAFVRHFDAGGATLGTAQIGSIRRDDAQSVTADAAGVYVAGHTAGELPTESSAGSVDGFIVRLSDNEIVPALDVSAMLGPATPNPFNPATRIRYTLREPTSVRLAVYDVRGRLVDTLVDGTEANGEHAIQWNATGVASGAYFIRLEAAGRVESQRVILLK